MRRRSYKHNLGNPASAHARRKARRALGSPIGWLVSVWNTNPAHTPVEGLVEIASANVESARVAMFALVGRVDGGGVGVGVCPQDCVVLGAEHVEQSTIGTQGA